MSRRPPSHRDFSSGSGFSTQALVPWINRETGERWTAPSGGYSPREGSGWEREGATRKKPDVSIPTPPRKEIVKRPTRDLNDDRVYIGGPSPIKGVPGHDYVNDPKYKDHRENQQKPKYGRWQDTKLPEERVWSGGSRDFDERTGTNRPGHRGGGYEFTQTEKERARERLKKGSGIRKTSQGAADFLNERGIKPDDKAGLTRAMIEYDRKGSRREKLRPEPRDLVKEAKKQGTYRDDPGPNLRREPKREWWNEPKKEYRPEKSTKEKRLELLTGGGGRRSSDTDRYSLLTGRGLSSNEDRMAMLTGRSDPPKEEWKSQYGGRREYDPQDREFNRQFNTEPTDNRDVRSWFPDSEPSSPVSKPSSFPDDVGPGKKYPFGKPDPSHPPGVLYSKGPGPAPNTNQGYDDSSVRERLRALEERPQSTGGDWQEDRIAALENRKPIVNQSTVDLSGVKGRISQLEGKGPSWQEDRVKQLEGSRSESKSARNLLDQRIASLENYYKNDPPPAESTGNRYEDKMASLVKGWDMTDKATKWDLEDDRLAGYRNVRDKSGTSWANKLEEGYVQGVRDLNREYNKPIHTANIKGREYKAYDPKAAARLRYLDDQNIHEDTYLGQGTWQNQYGEDVKGWDRGYQDRYFTSQSGLDKDSDEYKKRFGSHFSGDTGKDYAWYQ